MQIVENAIERKSLAKRLTNTKLNTGQFLTQAFICTYEISYDRRNRNQKPKRPGPTPYRWGYSQVLSETSYTWYYCKILSNLLAQLYLLKLVKKSLLFASNILWNTLLYKLKDDRDTSKVSIKKWRLHCSGTGSRLWAAL